MRGLRQLAGLAVLAAAPAWADIDLPQASPAATVSLKVGTTKVKIEYHRPGVKGRVIWGSLVPYDAVWRLGANEATTFEVSDPVKVAGQALPEGTYAIFAIPGKESWTIVLNRTSKQWGAFSYRSDDDALRFVVRPETAPYREWMSFAIEPTGPGGAEVSLAWERLRIAFPVEVDVPGIVWGEIGRRLAKPDAGWQDFFQAARYSLDEGSHRAEALVWADKALAGKPSFWTYELKARVLQREGRTAEALPWLEKAIVDAQGTAPKEYVDGLRTTIAEWKAAGK